jgi:hypothetical protein
MLLKRAMLNLLNVFFRKIFQFLITKKKLKIFSFIAICLYIYLVLIPKVVKYKKEYYAAFNYKPFYLNQNKQYCDPFRTSLEKQYRVKIDGLVYPQYVPDFFNKSIDYKCLDRYSDKKVVLLWNLFFQTRDYDFGIGYSFPFTENNCPVTNCEITNDKTRLKEADLVVVHIPNYMEPAPLDRPSNQRWVFLVLESPLNTIDLSSDKFKNVFNLTSTYKKDSDFANYYEFDSTFIWKFNETFDENFDFSSGKTKLAASVISNCKAWIPRSRFLQKLQEYIPIDNFGACGNKVCTRFFHRKSQCKEIIGREYKFFFAIENSLCEEYITEKFFQTFKYNIVPVVLGSSKNKYDYFVSNLSN